MKKLPKWTDLPQLDLYLDQVLLYVNQETQPFLSLSDKGLTAAMINNYVKHSHLTKPIKKKYTRHHLARLLVISLCKPLFPIAVITDIIRILEKEKEGSHLYDDFVACLQGENPTGIHPLIVHACLTIQAYQKTLALAESLTGDHHETEF